MNTFTLVAIACVAFGSILSLFAHFLSYRSIRDTLFAMFMMYGIGLLIGYTILGRY